MPQIFKALLTVSIWGLAIGAWWAAVMNVMRSIMTGYMFRAEPPPLSFFAGFAVCIGFAFAAGFLVLVRKKLE